MPSAFLTRSIRVLAVAALCSTIAVPRLGAEPITVTSGQFRVDFDNPDFFRFFGAGGFELSGIFIQTISSPVQTCLLGCLPGTVVDMSATAGGESTPTSFSLGFSTGAVINGTEISPPFGLRADSPWMTGSLRFDAPAVVLRSLEGIGSLTVPFMFNGHVTGFDPTDLEGRMPLFDLLLVGQGTAFLQFEDFDFATGTYRQPVATYTFSSAPAPVPEPTVLTLFGTGLIGIAARTWRHKRGRPNRRISSS